MGYRCDALVNISKVFLNMSCCNNWDIKYLGHSCKSVCIMRHAVILYHKLAKLLLNVTLHEDGVGSRDPINDTLIHILVLITII